MYSVYIILCSDGTLYTGTAKNAFKRFLKHKEGKGAKYTRTHCPEKLVAVWDTEDKSTALKTEMRIKKLTKNKKEELIRSPEKIESYTGLNAEKSAEFYNKK